MLTLKRAGCHGTIHVDLLSHKQGDLRIETLAPLGKVLIIPAFAGDKRLPIDLALPVDRADGKLQDAMRQGIFPILTRLHEIEENGSASQVVSFEALGDWHVPSVPGAPLVFYPSKLAVIANAPRAPRRNIMLITYPSVCSRTGRAEVRISHGVDVDTGTNIPLEDAPLSSYRSARYDQDAGEFFLRD